MSKPFSEKIKRTESLEYFPKGSKKIVNQNLRYKLYLAENYLISHFSKRIDMSMLKYEGCFYYNSHPKALKWLTKTIKSLKKVHKIDIL